MVVQCLPTSAVGARLLDGHRSTADPEQIPRGRNRFAGFATGGEFPLGFLERIGEGLKKEAHVEVGFLKRLCAWRTGGLTLCGIGQRIFRAELEGDAFRLCDYGFVLRCPEH